MTLTNTDVARALREIALFLEMENVPFKPRSYEKAAQSIATCDEPCSAMLARGGVKALAEIPGVGKSIAEKIAELLTTGVMAYHEELRARTPIDVAALTAVEGVGPKGARALYQALGVTDLESLEAAARAGRIRALPRFGEKSEEKILRGLAFAREHHGRMPLGDVLPLVRDIEARLAALPGVERATIAGSIRRRRETVGDADILVIARRAAPVMERVAALPEVARVLAKGDTKISVRLAGGLQMDVRVVPRASFGAALHYFTGSKAHNVALRQIAIKKGLKLNEYGVFRGDTSIAGKTEEEVYAALDLPFIAPELREDVGEIDAARAGRLPQLIEHGSLRGDLQTQTTWTDGADTLEAMAEAAHRLGLQYMAITDHTRDLAMTSGADEAKLRKQGAAIDALNARLEGFRVLKGAEVNIRKDGTLDIADDALAELDVVGIAVHSHFLLPRAEMTARVLRAMRNPHADILFHPTARILGKREPIDVDMDAVIACARETGTVLELDAYPARLDLRDDHVRKAVAAGVKLVIDSDAHATAQLQYPDGYGIDQARRGWATRDDVLNTRPVEQFLAALKGGAKTPPPRSRGAKRPRKRET
ncbi:MAG: DNA polymerase/3'-5' exonuclease PolX [Deltaproteobacteria bacterium]|nr:MAG: DNA polymerase/3'-5' exonuclease PolX [Deltaproteobacteria bacterium]